MFSTSVIGVQSMEKQLQIVHAFFPLEIIPCTTIIHGFYDFKMQ
jgi:hypothetical protein